MGFMDKLKGAAESVQAQTSKVGVGASADQMSLANKAKKLMDSGIETPAHIDSMQATGNTDTPGGAENNITATVKPAGGEAYQVRTRPVSTCTKLPCAQRGVARETEAATAATKSRRERPRMRIRVLIVPGGANRCQR